MIVIVLECGWRWQTLLLIKASAYISNHAQYFVGHLKDVISDGLGCCRAVGAALGNYRRA